VVEPHLKKCKHILDVGSGQLPCPRATILADYFPDKSIHRSDYPVVEDRPLVVCSAQRLPFLAGVFDFVICSHVLEHLDDPVGAVAQMARVARAGYFETPAYGKDILVGTGRMHRWQVVEFDGSLHFFEYSRRQKEAHVHSPVMDLWLQETYHPWQDFFWERRDLFNASVVWKATPPTIYTHRRANSAPAKRPPWKPIAPDRLLDAPCALTRGEIDVLTRLLATPDGVRPMTFQENCFVAEGGIRYPVRGKRIYCEMGTAGR
jgi:SAM-dependent methyltransferase